jgi:hypothetical protein
MDASSSASSPIPFAHVTRTLAPMALAAALLAGCGAAGGANKIANSFRNPDLGCVASHAPVDGSLFATHKPQPSGKFQPIVAPGETLPVAISDESLGVRWPNGNMLILQAYPSAGAAEKALRQIRREQTRDLRGPGQPPKRRGAIVVLWTKAPSSEQAAVLQACLL